MKYENLLKVSTKHGTTHVTDGSAKTLCGIAWLYYCDHGTDRYCERCQRSLSRIKREAAGPRA